MFGPSMTAVYAVRALVHLTRCAGPVRGGARLAVAIGAPAPYLVHVLRRLARGGLLLSRGGPRGGYRLAREPGSISVLEVWTAVDGGDILQRCLLGLGRCSSERRCPLHETWAPRRQALLARLEALSLSELASFESWDVERDYRFGLHGPAGREQGGRQ